MHYYKTSKDLKLYEKDDWVHDLTSTHLVSFTDFIRWIALSSKRKNPHFEPATRMCPPCQNFNFIVKVETMNEDLAVMFNRQKFKIPENWILTEPKRNFEGGFSTKNISHTITKTSTFYAPVSRDVLETLVDKFNHDMKIFGYTFDVDSKTPGGFT